MNTPAQPADGVEALLPCPFCGGDAEYAGVVVPLTPTPMIDRAGWREPAYRLVAYYYTFRPTGIDAIDLILSAVACAGKAFHHTESWQDECEPYHDRLRGGSPQDWIQNAAADAAEALRTTPAQPEGGRGEADDEAARRYIRDWCPDHVKDYIDRLATPTDAAVEGDKT